MTNYRQTIEICGRRQTRAYLPLGDFWGTIFEMFFVTGFTFWNNLSLNIPRGLEIISEMRSFFPTTLKHCSINPNSPLMRIIDLAGEKALREHMIWSMSSTSFPFLESSLVIRRLLSLLWSHSHQLMYQCHIYQLVHQKFSSRKHCETPTVGADSYLTIGLTLVQSLKRIYKLMDLKYLIVLMCKRLTLIF